MPREQVFLQRPEEEEQKYAELQDYGDESGDDEDQLINDLERKMGLKVEQQQTEQ